MISGALEIYPGSFVNWNKVMRVDFHDKNGKRHVFATFSPDNVINYGEVTPEQEAYVRRQLRGEEEQRENSAGFR